MKEVKGKKNKSSHMNDTSPDSFNVDDAITLAQSSDDALLKKMDIEIPIEEQRVDTHKDEKYKAKVGSKKAPKKFDVKVVDPTKEIKIPTKTELDLDEPNIVTREHKKLYEDIVVQETETPKEIKPNLEQEKLDSLFADKAISESELIRAVAESDHHVREMDKSHKRKRFLALGMLIFIAFFVLIFAISAILQFSNSFTVSLNKSDLQQGLTLYDNVAREKGTSRLMTEDIPDCDNITYKDFADKIFSTKDNQGIDNIDGNHSGKNFFAYTFYVSNDGTGIIDYSISINMVESAKGLDDAIRVMVISDTTFLNASDSRRIVEIYAKPKCDPVTNEWLKDNTGGYVMQELLDSTGKPSAVQDNAKAFSSKSVAYHKEFKGLYNSAPINMHKYTIMIYLEGGDPDCINDIRGGAIRFSVELKVTNYRANPRG